MPSEPQDKTTRLTIPSDAHQVRLALCTLFDALATGPLPPDTRDTAQIVLAEALNNIVEHAYGTERGEIEVTLHTSATGLHCQIADFGRPMPGGILPEGRLSLPHLMADLPEGGFGWHLIRSLSQDLRYRYEGGCNRLEFRIESQQSAL